jgi:hypothetical protein
LAGVSKDQLGAASLQTCRFPNLDGPIRGDGSHGATGPRFKRFRPWNPICGVLLMHGNSSEFRYFEFRYFVLDRGMSISASRATRNWRRISCKLRSTVRFERPVCRAISSMPCP